MRKQKKTKIHSYTQSVYLQEPSFMLPLPAHFTRRIVNTFGEAGQNWLNQLPHLINTASALFNIHITTPLPHLSFNYVAYGEQKNGDKVIVKFGAPTIEFEQEIAALQLMKGDGVVKVIAYDKQNKIALLEALMPGAMLTTITDEAKATTLFANIVKKIKKPARNLTGFPTTQQWFERLAKPISLPPDFPENFIEAANKMASQRHKISDNRFLLHGDLHHFNILSAKRQPWIAIDPKGVIGPLAYECGAFLRNPIPQIGVYPNLSTILGNRVAILSNHLGFEKKEIIGWGFAQSILASVWCLDSQSDDWKIFLKCAEALFDMLEKTDSLK